MGINFVDSHQTFDDCLLGVYVTVRDLVLNCEEALAHLSDPQEREYAHKLHEAMLHVKKTMYQLGRDVRDALPPRPGVLTMNITATAC